MSAMSQKKRLQPEEIEKIFSWCENTFVQQTVTSFEEQMDSVLGEIKSISNEIASYEEKQVYNTLIQKLTVNKIEMREAFGVFLKKYFEEKIIPNKDFEFNASDLRIVTENELDNKIASINLEKQMNEKLGSELKNLSERMEFLLGKDTNPFSTDILASALTSALEQILQDIAMQKQVVSIFSQKWPESIKNTYEGMNSFLIDNDVLVDLGAPEDHVKKDRKPEMDIKSAKSALFQEAFGKRLEDERYKEEQYEKNSNSYYNTSSEGVPRINLPPLPHISQQDIVNMFSKLINKSNNYGSGAFVGGLNSQGQGITLGVPGNHHLNGNSSLSRHGFNEGVQQVNHGTSGDNLTGAQQVSQQTLDTIQEFTKQLHHHNSVYRNTPIATGVVQNIIQDGLNGSNLQLTNIIKSLSGATENKVDKIIVDLVSVVFDNVFSLSNVPDHVKFLIGKLQIPVLKAALNDNSFFTAKDSSVRLFLQKITKKETAYNQESMSKFEDIIEKILTVENINDDIFNQAIVEINSLISTENKKEEQIVEKSSPILTQNEKCSEHLEQLIAYTKTMTDKVHYEPLRIFIEKIWAPHFAKKWSSSIPENSQNFIKGLQLEAKVQLNHGIIVFDMLFRSLVIKDPSPLELEQLKSNIPKIRDGLNKVCFDLRISNEDAQGLGFLLAEKHLFLIQREEEKKKIHQKNIQENENNIIEVYKHKESIQQQVKKADIEIHATESNFNIIFVKGTWFNFKSDKTNMKLLWVSPKRTLFLFSNPKDKKVYSLEKAKIWEQYKNQDVTMLPADEIDTEVLIGNAIHDISKNQ